ncbi:MAG: sulfatase-like hydrolase/transferase [Planctomycetota bacterium]
MALGRRDFFKLGGSALAASLLPGRLSEASMSATKPNIVFVFTDQQSFRMMGCAGNEYLETPAMDSIAAEGVRFDRAYCTNPVCVPSRFSLLTGRYPTAIGQRSNPSRHLPDIPETITDRGLGHLLREGGYETVYGGKVHLPKGLTPEDLGFEVIAENQRDELADVSADYLRREHDRPFAMVASFINPHDICYMGIRAFPVNDFSKLLVEKGETEIARLEEALERPPGVSEEEFWAEYCPPLPPNFEPQENEPEAITELVEGRPFRKMLRQKWSEKDWRLHRWAYCRLTEMVDEQIGRLLDGLRGGPNAENTIVIFSSDHGDHDSSHQMEHKSAPYEEAARIPMLVSAPGGRRGAVEQRLVSNGLDLLPTLCDYAGVEVPGELQGLSLRPLVEDREPDYWRDEVLIESSVGFALRTDRYKYLLCDEGEHREQLYDLKEDPWETRNFARDADKWEVVSRMRRRLLELRPQLKPVTDAAAE